MSEKVVAKPFLKWAGGKSQLISSIEKRIPNHIVENEFAFFEPFVGSGAVLFWMLNKYPNIKKAVINDVNADLINTYKTIAKYPLEIIYTLDKIQNEYYSLEYENELRRSYYNEKRELFNSRESDTIDQSALFIFLNKTCFNGLYRVNSKNEFNVPMGSYKRPLICDKRNLLSVSETLKKVEILCGDFEQTFNYIDDNKNLFYLDPPYKPLSNTSSFNSYTKESFDDSEQIRLKAFCDKLSMRKCSWILSNSDVRNYDKENDFFDSLYSPYRIDRVKANRMINSNSSKRGSINELLITNL